MAKPKKTKDAYVIPVDTVKLLLLLLLTILLVASLFVLFTTDPASIDPQIAPNDTVKIESSN